MELLGEEVDLSSLFRAGAAAKGQAQMGNLSWWES